MAVIDNVQVVRRNHTYPLAVELIVWECPSCGIVYGIPTAFADSTRFPRRPHNHEPTRARHW
jgi:hypothetical protein